MRSLMGRIGVLSPESAMLGGVTVADDGTLTFYDRVKRPSTWSEHVRRTAEREYRRSGPRAQPE
jgi:hypothetical protein